MKEKRGCQAVVHYHPFHVIEHTWICALCWLVNKMFEKKYTHVHRTGNGDLPQGNRQEMVGGRERDKIFKLHIWFLSNKITNNSNVFFRRSKKFCHLEGSVGWEHYLSPLMFPFCLQHAHTHKHTPHRPSTDVLLLRAASEPSHVVLNPLSYSPVCRPAVWAGEILITTSSVWRNGVRYCCSENERGLRLLCRKTWWPLSVLWWLDPSVHFQQPCF